MPTPTPILDYWFGECHDGWIAEDRSRLWFAGRPEDDAEMSERFGAAIDAALAGDLEAWREEPTGALAYILLLDQMTRATRRGAAAAFAGDPLALAACHAGLRSGQDQALPPVCWTFFYLPLEHSESLADQERCVALSAALRDSLPERVELLQTAHDYAVQHCDIIARFGRFPHRNAVLGRQSTPEEVAYLEGGGGRFGQ